MKLTLILLLFVNFNICAHKSIVDSYFKPQNNCLQQSLWFYFCGTEKQLDRVIDWINEILTYEIGDENIFREQEALRKGEEILLRDHAGYGDEDMQVWFGLKSPRRNLSLAEIPMS